MWVAGECGGDVGEAAGVPHSHQDSVVQQTTDWVQQSGGWGRPVGGPRPWVPGHTRMCGCVEFEVWQPLAEGDLRGPAEDQQHGGQVGPWGHSGAGDPDNHHSSETTQC